MHRSRSKAAGDAVQAADAERGRRESAGLRFPSVLHALRFLWERGQAMQAPLGQHPRGETASDGSVVFVDGARGRGDPHELLTTLQTVHAALVELHLSNPVGHEMLILSARDGRSMLEIGKLANCSPSTVSSEIRRAEGFLLGWLRRADVVMPGRL
jgi:DNA-directed RNA polymerase specialized sigma24 family protein